MKVKRIEKQGLWWRTMPEKVPAFVITDFKEGEVAGLSAQVAEVRKQARRSRSSGPFSSGPFGHLLVVLNTKDFYVYVGAHGYVRAARGLTRRRIRTNDPAKIVGFRKFG